MNKKYWLILFLSLFFINKLHAQYVFERLHANYIRGQLNYEQYLVYSALNIFNRNQVPTIYQPESTELPLKSGTFLIQEIKANWDKLSPDAQNLLTPYFQRPNLPNYFPSATGKFIIHYTTEGSDKVDATDYNRNNIPDYVEAAVQYFDHTHQVIVDQLDYKPPAADSSGKGKAMDIYLVNLTGCYGITWLEETVPGNANAYSCYIEVDNDFNGFKISPLQALSVTAAHEYFHAVQVGYCYRDEDVFFMDMCSTWMEDFIYNEVNDYIFYLDNFFKAINYPFYYTNGSWFEYASCLWIHMIVKKYEPDVIRKIWEAIQKQKAFTAIQEILSKYGTSFNQELASFGLWNYFTGSRADTVNYYSEGNLYPEVRFEGEFPLQDNSLNLNEDMRKLSSTYYQLTDLFGGKTIGLVITNFEIPDNNYLSTDRANFVLNLASIVSNAEEDNLFLFLINNLVKLTDNVGVRLGDESIDQQNWIARAVIFDRNNQSEVFQFFPTTPFKKTKDYIYKIFPNPFIIGEHDSLKVYNVITESQQSSEIDLFTANGRLVKNDKFDTPKYRYSWDGRNENGALVSSGVYIVLLRVGGFVDMKKVAVMRK